MQPREHVTDQEVRSDRTGDRRQPHPIKGQDAPHHGPQYGPSTTAWPAAPNPDRADVCLNPPTSAALATPIPNREIMRVRSFHSPVAAKPANSAATFAIEPTTFGQPESPAPETTNEANKKKSSVPNRSESTRSLRKLASVDIPAG